MKKHPRLVRALSFALAAILLSATPAVNFMPTAAATISEQIEELEKEQKNLKNQISSAKNDVANSKKLRDLYTSQISNVKKQIELLDNQVSTLQSSIQKLEKQLEDNTAEKNAVKEILGKRLHALVKRGNFSSLQMLLNTESYTDYLVRSTLMKKIAEKDQAAIDELEEKLRQIELDEQKLKQEKEEAERLRASSNAKKNELNNLYTAANNAYKQDQAELDALNAELQKTEASIKKLLASLQSNGNYTGYMYWPVPTVRAISSYFGSRWGTFHKGVDIANGSIPIYGQNIVAAADGEVIYANSTSTWGGGYGYYCMVDHGKNSKGQQVVTLYAHCSKMYARVGQKVVGGKTVLGQAGATGNVTGPHLHFEVRLDGTPVDPLKGYISVNGK